MSITNKTVLYTIGGGVKISWGGSKYRYDISTPGSKYRTIYWPRGQYIGGSKYRLTPAVAAQAAAYEPVQKHKVTPSILGWLNYIEVKSKLYKNPLAWPVVSFALGIYIDPWWAKMTFNDDNTAPCLLAFEKVIYWIKLKTGSVTPPCWVLEILNSSNLTHWGLNKICNEILSIKMVKFWLKLPQNVFAMGYYMMSQHWLR